MWIKKIRIEYSFHLPKLIFTDPLKMINKIEFYIISSPLDENIFIKYLTFLQATLQYFKIDFPPEIFTKSKLILNKEV